MAKALVGYRMAYDQRLMLETLELRRRVADLEHLVDRLQRDNDQLREDLHEDVREDLRQPDKVAVGAPTIAG
jgi:RecB family endonuclease NucS